jgi:rRNA maturation endonuclease Nob1
MEVRTVENISNKLTSSNHKLDLVLVQNDISEDQYRPGIYAVKCRGCGASIDIMKEKCDHCGAKINYLQSWYISKILDKTI